MAQRIDSHISLLNAFFDTLVRPPDMSDKDFAAFTKFATAFFPQEGRLWRKHSDGAHKLVISPNGRIRILQDCHNGVAHRGVFATKSLIAERFWWPDFAADIAWYIRTCHLCQTRRHQHILIPPTVASPAPLFARVYMDTMHLPPSQRYKYLVQAQCSLSTFPEWAALRRETGRAIGEWIYINLLCRWGALLEIITDNGTPFVKALEYLATKYKVHHIRISGYNSRANGIVERAHYDVRQALYKAADGEENRWYAVAHSVFWSERVTIRKRMGCSPYFAVTGTHPVLPLNIAEATYLIPPPDRPLSTTELIANCAIALQRRQDQLEKLHSRVLATRCCAAIQFERDHQHTIRDFDFKRSDLVLIRNTRIEKGLTRKMRPRYLGPLIVVARNYGGVYILCKLDGAVMDRLVAAFRVVPYFARAQLPLPDNFEDITPERLREMRESNSQGDDDKPGPYGYEHKDHDDDCDSLASDRAEPLED